MKQRYIFNLSPLFVLYLLFTILLVFSEAFGAVQQENEVKVRPGKRNTARVRRFDPRVNNNRPVQDSLTTSWLQKTVAASLKRNPAKSLAQIRAARAQRSVARKSAAVAVPAILFVNKNADGENNGSSWENAFEELGEALKYAHDNAGVQQVWVANGVYYPLYDYDYIDEDGEDAFDRTFRLLPDVKMYGGFTGVEQSLAERKLRTTTGLPFNLQEEDEEDLFTILGGTDRSYHVVMSAGDVGSASLDGFVITEGNASETSDVSVEGMTIPRNAGGGIVVVNSSPLLINLLITYNNAENGAGIYMTDSSPRLTNLQISYNRATNGSAIYAARCGVVLTNSIINDNRAYGAGAVYLLNSSEVLTNLTIARNRGEGSSGLVVEGGSPKIRNTIINGNQTNADTEVAVIGEGAPSFAHCIVAGSGGSDSWNAGFGNDLGGNLDVDPGFYNIYGGLFGLYPGSNSVNKGNNLYFQSGQIPDLSGLITDMRGTARITKGTVDIGALESLFGILNTSLTPNEDGILFVKKGGSGLKNGHDWENAAAELADAVFASNLLYVEQIWVAGGKYHPLYRPDDFSKADPKSPYNAFLLLFNTELHGGFKGDETSLADRDLRLTENASILSGDFNGNDNFNFTDLYNNGVKAEFSENAHHLVYGFNLGVQYALDGVTIEGANNTSAISGETLFIFETVVPTELGAGIFIHLTNGEVGFQNLVIKNNLGSHGGGFTGHGSESMIKNSAIYHNYDKGYGSGILDMASQGDLEIFNTTVAQNLSTPGPIGAGVASVEGYFIQISNSVIANNIQSGSEQSAQANFFSDGVADVYFANSILAGSGGSVNWQLAGIGDDGGNLDVDPQFVDMNAGDFSLAVCSRAIDAGDIELYSDEEDIPSVDLAGNNRVFNNRIDMGAFEFQTQRSPNATALAGNAKESSFTFGDEEGNAMHTFTAEADVCDSDLLTMIPANLSGLVNAKVWVDAQVNSYANAVYLQRHFDINPTDNAASATSRVVLYFTQSEFDALNLKLTALEYLPTGQPDGEDERKANLRIYQFHGESSDGSGSPASYGSSRTVIDPDDQDIKWNAAQNRWEVSFFVEGFSSFFGGTVTQNPLPVRLISFEGKQTDDQKVKLDWKVTEQENILVYEVEYSHNAKAFDKIGQVDANVLASTDYSYTDTLMHPGERAYYRLKISEMDGKTAYSKLVSVKLPTSEGLVAYPLPAKNELWIDWKKSDASSAEFMDLNGRSLKTIRKSSASQKVDISGFPAGVFLLKTNGKNVLKVVKE